MKTAIVLGLTGMDGRTITYQLLREGYKVVGTIRSNTDQENAIRAWYALEENKDNLIIEYCDINDYSSVNSLILKHSNTAELYLLAAQSHVGKSFNSPYESCVTNGMSVFNVLDSIYKNKLNIKTYFASTSETLGGKSPKEGGYDETDEYDCRSPYSIGKELGTRWVKYYRQLGVFACYGVLFNHSNNFRNESFFIKKVTKAAARIHRGQQKDLLLGNLNFYRDEHWSDYGVEMMRKMLQNNTPTDYIIATEETHHGEEYLDLAFGYFNLNWRDYVKFDSSQIRPNEVVKLIGNSSKAKNELGWNPKRMSFKNHIEEMCRYDDLLIDNPNYDSIHKYPDYLKLFP